ncbi:polysaccharide deacetylase family protein [Micromonospora sp. LOL_023]|uniref:polysaccharide deacetylase family protein n=1 Tax=Micromonospora sp. LOL_023 TaxID=3345418 RepID=UPI003A863A26
MSRRTVFAAGLTVFALFVGSESISAMRGAREVPAQWSAVAGFGAAPGQPDGLSVVVPAPRPAPSVDDTNDSRPPPAGTATPGASPRPTVDPGLLQRRTGNRQVAITFDDGPHPQWTPLILDELRTAGVKATFCLVGAQVRRYPALVTRIVREGHTLCNHSWGHELDLGLLPEAEIRANLLRTTKEIHRVVPGAPVEHFRHPAGAWTPAAVAVADELGMVSLDWDVDPRDWDKPTKDQLIEHIQTESRLGSVILLHDGGGDRSATVAALPTILQELRQRYGIMPLGANLSP